MTNCRDIVMNIVMPTSIHLPNALLEAVDRKARALRISRNQLIVRALERELQTGGDWSPGFFERLADVDSDTVKGVEDLLTSIRATRTSKPPRALSRVPGLAIEDWAS